MTANYHDPNPPYWLDINRIAQGEVVSVSEPTYANGHKASKLLVRATDGKIYEVLSDENSDLFIREHTREDAR